MAKVKRRIRDDSIEMLKGAERSEKNRRLFSDKNGIEGCEHSVFEACSNSVDEAREGFFDYRHPSRISP